MKKIVRSDEEALDSMKAGIDFAANRVKRTLGPSGRNTSIGRRYQSPEITNDGKTTLDELWVRDEIAQLAIDILKDVAKEMFEESEDGTTTAVTLTQAILSYGYEKIKKNPITGEQYDPMRLRAEILAASKEIQDELDKRATPISTLDEIREVAFVSVENRDIADIIAKIFFHVGKDGVVTVEEGHENRVESEIVEGMEIEAGLFTAKLANQGLKYVFDNPKVLVTNEALNNVEQIEHFTTELAKNKDMQLIILADTFGKDMYTTILQAKFIYGFTIIPIKTPFFGKSEQLHDIAIALGATFVDKESMRLADMTTQVLGTVGNITVTKDKTIMIGIPGDVTARAEEIKAELAATENAFDKKQLEKRLARILGKVGIIRVGADSTKEVAYLMKKVKNAVGATKNALKEGVVRGGGLALVDVAVSLPDNILSVAITKPSQVIQENAGGNLVVDPSVVDPVKTEKTALRIAASVASLILTTGTAIADAYEEPKDIKE